MTGISGKIQSVAVVVFHINQILHVRFILEIGLIWTTSN